MARGRRKSSKPKSGNPAANADFESLSFPGGSAVRAGRNVYLRSDIDANEHARRLQSVADSIPGLEAKRNAGRDRLEEILRETGPLECVARASATYLVKDAETYRESEDDRSPAHIEFLALAALPLLQAYRTVQSTASPDRSRRCGVIGV